MRTIQIYTADAPPPSALIDDFIFFQNSAKLKADQSSPPLSTGFVYTVYTVDEILSLIRSSGARLYACTQEGRTLGIALTTDPIRFVNFCQRSKWNPSHPRTLKNYRYLEQIVVAPGVHGRGVGSALLKEIQTYEPRIVTDFSVKPHLNREARRFFILRDFTKLGELIDLQYRGHTLGFEAVSNQRTSGVESKKGLFRVLASAIAITCTAAWFETSALREALGIPPGIFSATLEICFWIWAAMVLTLRKKQLLPFQITNQTLWVGISFWLLAAADFLYGLKYFVLDQSRPMGGLAGLISVLYIAGFISLVAGLYGFFESRFRVFKGFFGSWVSIAWLSTASVWLLRPILLGEAWKDVSTLSRTIEVFSVLGSCLLFFVSSILSVVTRSRFWNVFFSGAMILVFGDWAIKYQKFYQVSVSYQIFESLWLLGALIMTLSIIRARDHLPQISGRSIALARALPLAVIFIFAVFVPSALGLSDIQFRNWIAWIAITPLFLALILMFFEESSSTAGMELESEKAKLLNEERILNTSELEKAKAVSEITRQVSHDIRSPLAALDILLKTPNVAPEDSTRQLLSHSVRRIREILNDLNARGAASMGTFLGSGTTFLPYLIDNVVSEKRSQIIDQPKIRIGYDRRAAYDSNLFCTVNAVHVARTLSNIIQNSIDATSDTENFIDIRAKGAPNSNFIELTIADTGVGIAPEILPLLFLEGATFKKVGGSGLGLYHAKSVLEGLGGKLTIAARPEGGTQVTLLIPKSKPSTWFTKPIQTPGPNSIIIVDDDPTIADLFRQAHSTDSVKNTYLSLAEFERSEDFKSAQLILMDYHFNNSTENGLQFIERHGLQARSILVTMEADSPEVQRECERLGVKLLWKMLIDIQE